MQLEWDFNYKYFAAHEHLWYSDSFGSSCESSSELQSFLILQRKKDKTLNQRERECTARKTSQQREEAKLVGAFFGQYSSQKSCCKNIYWTVWSLMRAVCEPNQKGGEVLGKEQLN